MVSLTDRKSDTNPEDLERIGNLALQLGVELNEDAKDEAAAAVAMWLFDGSVENLPGGYDKGELSPNSPVKELKSFPQDLVLVGRSSILIKGLSNRLNVPWSLAKEWSPYARELLYPSNNSAKDSTERVRFRTVRKVFKQWSSGRIMKLVTKLPPPLRTRLAAIALKRAESKQQ